MNLVSKEVFEAVIKKALETNNPKFVFPNLKMNLEDSLGVFKDVKNYEVV